MVVTGSRVCTTNTACCSRGVQPGSLLPRTSRQILEKKRRLRRSAVSCANCNGNVYLTLTYDAACNLGSTGASCGVSETHLGGLDRLWCTSDEQTLQPPSSTHTQWFRPWYHLNSFVIPLIIRAVKGALSNLSTALG